MWVGVILSACLHAPCARALPVISEVLYDAVGADDGRVFVELYGDAGTVLDGLELVGINGADGGITTALRLSGSIPADGLFVVADASEGATSVANADLLRDFDFQNGPDSIQLLDVDGNVIDALAYGVFGPEDVFAGEGRAALDVAAGSSLARLFADVDRGDNSVDFVGLETPTPGSAPLSVPEPAGGAMTVWALGWLALRRLQNRPRAEWRSARGAGGS